MPKQAKESTAGAQVPPLEVHWPDGAVFSVGHSTLRIEDFVTLLQTYGIACLADIRTMPRSRYNPQFNGDALCRSLQAGHIDYVPLAALGGLRHPRKDSPNTGWRNPGFRGYADYMQTEDFAAGLAALVQMSQRSRTAIMCAEAVPWRCHRSLVSDALEVCGIRVVEILSASSYRVHALTPFAQVDGTRIVYPAEQGTLPFDGP